MLGRTISAHSVLSRSHTCEHLLLAVKLPPSSEFPNRSAPIPWHDPALAHLRRGIDGDVVVSEVRETSRKPDEVYGLLERSVRTVNYQVWLY